MTEQTGSEPSRLEHRKARTRAACGEWQDDRSLVDNLTAGLHAI